jgi:NAD(P)H-hydrate repair Nnr-like enzyme with NAD(P)H-hydrate epimerase domain
MPMTVKTTTGATLEVFRMFGTDRAIVFLEPGVPVIAVLTPAGWDTDSGEPARPGVELDTMVALNGNRTTVDVTAPRGTTTTFEDP